MRLSDDNRLGFFAFLVTAIVAVLFVAYAASAATTIALEDVKIGAFKSIDAFQHMPDYSKHVADPLHMPDRTKSIEDFQRIPDTHKHVAAPVRMPADYDKHVAAPVRMPNLFKRIP